MIRLHKVGKKFEPNRWVFRNIDLHIAAGQSVVLVGPSGSGKSVLLKIIAGLLPCSEGQVALGSQNISMLFQKNALFDSLTVEQNLLFPLKEKRGITGAKAKARAQELLHSVGLSGNEHLFPDEISGGMQKRLGIARALIVEPDILLYDEPTAGLDPITSRKIADLITQLRAQSGCTLLTVTNDMQRAYQIGDRICMLAQGQFWETGTPEQTQNSTDPAVRQFIFGLSKGPLTVSEEEPS